MAPAALRDLNLGNRNLNFWVLTLGCANTPPAIRAAVLSGPDAAVVVVVVVVVVVDVVVRARM